MMNIEEILISVAETKDLKERFNLLYEKGFSLMNKETTLALEVAEYILEESKKQLSSEGEAIGYNLKALCNTVLANHEIAIKNFTNALNSANKSLNEKLKGNILNNLGILFNQIGDLEKALIFFTDAYQIYEKGDDEKAFYTIIMNIGIIYLRTKNYNLGIDYLKKAQDYYKRVKDRGNVCLVANNLGMGFFTMENYTEAKKYFAEAVESADAINDKTNSCRSSLYLGLIALKEKDMTSAEANFHKSMTLAVENDMKIARVFNYKGFAQMYAYLKQFEKALDQLKNAMDISDKLELNEEKIEILQLFADIYSQMGNYEMAYKKLLEHKDLQAKWMNDENVRKIQQLQISNQIHQITREKELAEQTSVAKSNFLSNMSHEIRTPMNAVLGFSNLLMDSTALNEEDKGSVTAIKQSAENLIHILNEILDFSKIEAGKIEFKQEPFNVQSEVMKIQQMFTLQAKQKHLSINVNVDANTPLNLLGDSFRLSQVLINLTGNAMKFTSKGGVTINVKSLEILDGKANIQFQVCDTGIGIDNDRLERIFERFKQASAETSRYYGGTGLGLAISKQLVELQEGSMVVSQNPGGGSIFTFVIPFMIMDEQAILEQQKHIVPKQEIFYETFRMLVADDNPFNQLIVKKMMQKHYFNAIVEAVDNGKAAMSMISRFKYDVLLLDVKMPEMEGPEVAAIVKQMDEYKHIPIVAFTAGVTDEERKRCKNAGMDYFLPKPFSKEELFQLFVDTGIVKAEEKT